jgi:hypothetical protein
MCVPRSVDDPKCPSSQRPAGQTIFQAPDPLIMAPFKVGDYITFSGISADGETIAYSIVADSVQITTTGVPTYIRVEDAIIGTFDTQDPAEVAPADSRFIDTCQTLPLGSSLAALTLTRAVALPQRSKLAPLHQLAFAINRLGVRRPQLLRSMPASIVSPL